ncbi:hypothetical protein SLE2022_002970 [Rubroshorea leprosula]
MLIVWCWRSPVASVPQNLVQPFGRFLSWKAGDSLNDKIMVKGSDKKGRVCCLGKVPTFMWLSLQLKGPSEVGNTSKSTSIVSAPGFSERLTTSAIIERVPSKWPRRVWHPPWKNCRGKGYTNSNCRCNCVATFFQG